jgi:Histidine kinase-, DNA gyrase B-, and HSP90-like ATPase
MASNAQDNSIVAVDRFIEATRDSGYKGTPSAVAELVDNSLQAGADLILVHIEGRSENWDDDIMVEVIDNGCGMSAATLQQALRFGGTTRFNDRKGLGRYGMGLPNSSLSQARRVDVYTWRSPRSVLTSYLDVDEIARGKMKYIPDPVRSGFPAKAEALGLNSGTIVRWSRCDRLDYRRPSTIVKKLLPFLGRVFRYFLWDGVQILVNGALVKSIDPLFLHKDSLTHGGRQYELPLEYEVEIPLRGTSDVASGTVNVVFSELPVESWHSLSNDEKNKRGILKAAGVSIVRSGREVDYGWFFMGDKRKENYDDWWRCEVSFDPSLDEAFGITHTKQQIRPIHELLQILAPDIEATAKVLNRRVRQAHERLRAAQRSSDSEDLASAKDHLLKPLKQKPSAAMQRAIKDLQRLHPRVLTANSSNESLPLYVLVEGDRGGTRFFHTYFDGNQVVLALNIEHPFYKKFYKPLAEREDDSAVMLRRQVELVLLAAARAEVSSGSEKATSFLDEWSNIIAVFLQA